MNITIYSKPTCGKCQMLKTFLRENNLPYEDVNLEEDKEALDLMVKKNFDLLPVAKVDGEFLHGGMLYIKNRIKDMLK